MVIRVAVISLCFLNVATAQWWAEAKHFETTTLPELGPISTTPESSTKLEKILATQRPVEEKTDKATEASSSSSSSSSSSTTEGSTTEKVEEKPTEAVVVAESTTEAKPEPITLKPIIKAEIRAVEKKTTVVVVPETTEAATDASTTLKPTTMVAVTEVKIEETTQKETEATTEAVTEASTTEKEKLRLGPATLATLIPEVPSTEAPEASTTVEVFSKMLKPDLATIYRRLFNLKPFRNPAAGFQ
ncbi:unnamed protein product, partial [Mesorhabditis spiculigera]